MTGRPTSQIPLIFRPLSERCDRESLLNYDEKLGLYLIIHLAIIKLPGYNMRHVVTEDFTADRDELLVRPGYLWDGPSGPALNDETSVFGSLVHDIVCTRIDGKPILPGYFTRHALYRKINLMQGQLKFRANYQFVGLVLGNKIHDLKEQMFPSDKLPG